MKTLAVLVALLATACTGSGTAAPTATVTMTVQTLQYGTSVSIEGVSATINGTGAGTTGSTGRLLVQVPAGQEVTVAVQSERWSSFVNNVRGTLNADGEVWTFWMEERK